MPNQQPTFKQPTFQQAMEITATWLQQWDNEEISDEVLADRIAELGIARNTARAQLRSIFAKTGVSRQSMLVSLMLKSVVTYS